MGEHRLAPFLFIAAAFGASLAGCSSSTTGNAVSTTPQLREPGRLHGHDDLNFKSPTLLAFDNQSNGLEYWPIQPGGSSTPTHPNIDLGITAAVGLVSDRSYLPIAASNPSNMVTWKFGTQQKAVYPDPGGPPVDLAIAKGDTVYVLNANNVEGFPLDRLYPRTMDCSYITNGVSIAVDDQGDVFVNGYGPSFAGVVEYPYPTWNCSPVNLNPEQGVLGGIGIDPATNDLIVVDNPGSCQSSGDGRMTIYTPPYSPDHATQVNLNATYCAGTFRLDAASENMFLLDASGSQSQIDQLSYPEGQSQGVYTGGIPGGLTTYPQPLPN